MYYIQEIDKPNIILKLFNIIELKEDKIILPVQTEDIKEKKAEILAKKTNNILKQTNCNKIAISKKIKKQEQYINYLNTYNLEISDGKWLAEILSYNMIEYILKKKNIKKEETTISILINDVSDNMLENIKIMIKEFKRVNIVTNHISKFKNIEDKILDEYGTMITVTNNKKKSLEKASIILNVDFPSELINKYNIYEKAIILNLKGNVKINKKRFNGININDYEINIYNPEEFDYDKQIKYHTKEIYESQIYKKQPFENIIRKIRKDKVEISKLIAINTYL